MSVQAELMTDDVLLHYSAIWFAQYCGNKSASSVVHVHVRYLLSCKDLDCWPKFLPHYLFIYCYSHALSSDTTEYTET
jgi:hypothetical protein